MGGGSGLHSDVQNGFSLTSDSLLSSMEKEEEEEKRRWLWRQAAHVCSLELS